jgi:hypothetical protein
LGGLITILTASWNIIVGLAYSGIFSTFGLLVSENNVPFRGETANFFATYNLIYGVIGFLGGIIGLIGVKIGRTKGAVMMIISGIISYLSTGYLGIASLTFMITGGVLALSKKQTQVDQTPKEQ